MELSEKTLGLIGYGRIGHAVAKLANAFGMKVIAYNRTPKADTDICRFVSLDDVLKKSDIISLHCPLTKETNQIIQANTIAQMKDGAILINTARGGLIHEGDVASALKSRKIGAAALDVVTEEPMNPNNPLLTAPNCIFTPLIAWAPVESRQRLLNTVAENIRAFLDGCPENVVNM